MTSYNSIYTISHIEYVIDNKLTIDNPIFNSVIYHNDVDLMTRVFNAMTDDEKHRVKCSDKHVYNALIYGCDFGIFIGLVENYFNIIMTFEGVIKRFQTYKLIDGFEYICYAIQYDKISKCDIARFFRMLGEKDYFDFNTLFASSKFIFDTLYDTCIRQGIYGRYLECALVDYKLSIIDKK